MSKKFPLELFPVQLFPEVELEAVTVDSENKVLTISVSDSGWALSQDMEFFFGPGNMLFYFSGEMQIAHKQPADTTWKKENDRELLKYLGELEIIKKQDDGTWLFTFANRTKGYLVAIILEAIVKIEWSGEFDEKIYDLLVNGDEAS